MKCNCRGFEIVIALIILISSLVFPENVFAQWLVVFSAAALLIHAILCKNCINGCKVEKMESKPIKKTKKVKKTKK